MQGEHVIGCVSKGGDDHGVVFMDGCFIADGGPEMIGADVVVGVGVFVLIGVEGS